MDDTFPEIREEMKRRLMSFSGVQRLEIGARMFDASRELVLSSFSENMDADRLREKLFLRFYGRDLPKEIKESILIYLQKHH
ncbi:MAG: hypothetical protein R6V04_14850 [bacterium]